MVARNFSETFVSVHLSTGYNIPEDLILHHNTARTWDLVIHKHEKSTMYLQNSQPLKDFNFYPSQIA